MTGPMLAVNNLKVSFLSRHQWRPTVRDVSFNVGMGETVALVGESGSGKSVSALSVMRLLDPSSAQIEGSVKLEGRELLTLSEKLMRGVRGNEIAMIFQEPMTSLNPALTVETQIAEVIMAHQGSSYSTAVAETLRQLENVRIPAANRRMKEYPHQLSGGMRQRVMIAMALACRPKLLIADEPTTALDVTVQAQILELIRELQDENHMGVLFITHDMGVVAEIADKAVVMYQGEAIEHGPTAEIFRKPEKPYTRALLSAVPRLGSMQGQDQPARFPLVDIETGQPIDAAPMRLHVDSSKTPLLSVKNLTKRFNITSGFLGTTSARVHAVENISFDLKAGETLALVGESGCGKSTTGRAIMRLIDADEGKVLLDGKNILTQSSRDLLKMRRKVQMIFQDPFASLNPKQRIGEAIAEPLYAHRLANRTEAREKVISLLEQVGLDTDMSRRYPHEFSGGQRQRLCIARALSLEPKLIIADEAVSALDVSIKGQVINLMLDLQERLGLSYLFISHDMAVVERMSHRVAVMYLGEIVEIGPRAQIFANPQHPYTRKLLSAVPIPDPERRNIRRGVAVDEIKSPVRSLDYQVPQRHHIEVSPGHFVQQWVGDEENFDAA